MRYYAYMLAAGAFGVAKVGVYALVLGPAAFGELTFALLIATFLVFGVSRGLIEGMALRLPALYGAGQPALARALGRAGVAACVLPTAATAVIVGALALFGPGALIAVLAALLAGSTCMLSILLTDSRSRGDMTAFGVASLQRVAAGLILGLGGAAFAGAAGALVGEIAGQFLIGAWLLCLLRRAQASSDSAHSLVPEVRAQGRGLMLHQLSLVAQQNLERYFVIAAFGSAGLGQYSFAALAISVAALVHGAIYQHVGPEALRRQAQGVDLSVSLQHSGRVALWTSLTFAAAGCMVAFAAAELPSAMLAQYREGLTIMPILVVAAAFQVAQVFDWIVAASGRSGALARSTVATTLAQALFAAIGVWQSQPLWYFALIAAAGRAAVLLATLMLAYSAVRGSR